MAVVISAATVSFKTVRLLPSNEIEPIAIIPVIAAIREYSIAVEPLSSLRNLFNIGTSPFVTGQGAIAVPTT